MTVDDVKFGTESVRVESLPLSQAIPMALMESKGVRRMFDDAVKAVDDSARKLSAGMAVKALTGMIFGCHGYSSLDRIMQNFQVSPLDRLFGIWVKRTTLSDTNIGMQFDNISRLDLGELSWRCHELIHSDTEYGYFVIFLDGSNFTVYGHGYNTPGRNDGTMPMYGGNAKDGHTDRMQKNIIAMTDKEGHLMYAAPFDGNISDITMDLSAIEFVRTKVPAERTTIVADSKLANMTILPLLYDSGLDFVTKIPLNFNDRTHEAMVESALAGLMDSSKEHPGVEVFNSHTDMCGYDLRLVAFRLPGDLQKAEDFLRNRGLEDMRARAVSFKRRRFHCEADAMQAFRDMMLSNDCYAYDADIALDVDRKAAKKEGEPSIFGRVSNVRICEDRFSKAAQRYSLKVLGTNIRLTSEDHDNPRDGLTPFGVIDLYLKQDNAEKNFRRIKTEMGVDVSRLHKTNRQDVKELVCAMCVMMVNEMDTRLMEAGSGSWTDVRHTFDGCNVVYDRPNNTILFHGDEDVMSRALEVMDILGIEHRLILGH